ncbi:MAG: hypothetical protein HQK76_13805 [Desulfobacterales bacterium]|nr:hypothetical protein [Desulfobacterales bacterium]
MRKIIFAAIVMIIFIFPVYLHAEIYKYVGEDGKTYFTDNYNAIPENQRKKMDKIEEYEGSTATDTSSELPKNEAPQKNNEETIDLLEARKPLEKKQQDLDKEFKGLQAEKEIIDKDRDNAKTKTEILKYNEKVADYNKKLAEYEQKRKTFNSEVDEYNKLVKKDIADKYEKIKDKYEKTQNTNETNKKE